MKFDLEMSPFLLVLFTSHHFHISLYIFVQLKGWGWRIQFWIKIIPLNFDNSDELPP